MRLLTAVLVLSIAALAAAGCAPLRLTMDLRPAVSGFKQTEVLTDEGTSWGSPKVALISVSGLIADVPTPGVVGSRPSLVDQVAAQLRAVEGDPRVRAVVLRVNSPGGTVTGSDILHREIRRFAETTGKPVIASMGEMATSGGYYISIACDEIVAEPTTLTASIGVLVQTFSVHDGLSRIGIHARALTSGPNKAMGNPLDPPNQAQLAIWQGIVDDYYERFRGLVIERRGDRLDESQLDTMTDGRLVTGETALKLGLVDHTGGVRVAFERAKALAGLDAARLVAIHEAGAAPRSPWGAMAAADPMGPVGDREINLVQLRVGLGEGLAGAGFYYLWLPPELP